MSDGLVMRSLLNYPGGLELHIGVRCLCRLTANRSGPSSDMLMTLQRLQWVSKLRAQQPAIGKTCESCYQSLQQRTYWAGPLLLRSVFY